MNKMITILSFSPRNSGNCAAISRYVSKYHEKHIVHSIVIDRNAVPACGNCDCECLKPNLACPLRTKEYDRIMDTASQSDLVYFIVPNYCGYPCANYFSFNERSVGYFNMDRNKMEHYMSIPKRFIVISP